MDKIHIEILIHCHILRVRQFKLTLEEINDIGEVIKIRLDKLTANLSAREISLSRFISYSIYKFHRLKILRLGIYGQEYTYKFKDLKGAIFKGKLKVISRLMRTFWGKLLTQI